MRQAKSLLILALLCAMVQGAWAQDSWEEVYAMTETTSADWKQLNAGSTRGKTIGTANTTTYLHVTGNLTFSNSTAGGSGLTILGTVYLYVPQGVTVTCTGAPANGTTGAGAGIELAMGHSLFLLGKGAVNATGGNAANGGNGGGGGNANWNNSNYWSGTGGNGGNGGGGAGAGIGTRGGDGGQGGAGAASVSSKWSHAGGKRGSNATAGATAGATGDLYVSQSFGSLSATGGAAGTSGSAGSAGKSYLYDGSSNYCAAGGGGGGGGGFGGAATGIGTGGPGGGGGGGGASGNLEWCGSGYYVVSAPGGDGGQNADGTLAGDGAESILNHKALNNGQAVSNNSGWSNNDDYVSDQPVGTGGFGGSAGAASISESAVTVNVNIKLPTQEEWDIVCRQTNTSQSQWTVLPFGYRKGTTIGTAGATTYYFATGDRSFANSTVGGSGLTILGTVYLFIPSANQVTCTGANANGATGAGAGVELTAGNTLYLIGSGKLVATGGNAANGGNGQNGGDASFSVSNWVRSGDGGRGGDGGGGAGAGIGTRGADGGAGGAGGERIIEKSNDTTGNIGSNGANGGTAADMGTLYIYQMPAPTMEIHGGSGGTSGGNGGTGGLNVLCCHQTSAWDGMDYNWTAGGGAGGGGGCFGGAASDIGTGGPGGGGSGGGASGSIQYKSGKITFYQVGALGGSPGANADGTLAGAGESTMINSGKTNIVSNIELEYVNNLGWYNGDNRAAGGTGGDNGSASKSGTYYVVPATISLADNGDNGSTISNANGYLADVKLAGRTLYRDGSWNTLCLPFGVTLSGSPLEGAVARPLTSASISGTTLNLTFGAAVTELMAGTPYIIKWQGGDNIVSPVFSGVTIDATDRSYDNGATGEERVRFMGTYSILKFDAADPSILFMGSGNTLYYPQSGAAIGAQRAYFKIGDDGSAGALARITAFNISFGDDDSSTLGVTTPLSSAGGAGDEASWFTLDGRRLSGKPSRPGVYIYNGVKRVIK